ncbi:hypothetical protein TWF506_003728 [Arthrobotrys conoides]|uniref:Uncharacterized protein n=1 Tax=Arthrobotrys conoides TaxID=74498 RepID=A0AAN8P5S8_9PEZI
MRSNGHHTQPANKTRNLDRTVVTSISDLPGQAEIPPKQIHRILMGHILALFLKRDSKSQEVSFGNHRFIAQEGREHYRSRAQNVELIDLRGHLPGSIIGKITQIRSNPAYDEADSGCGREGIEQFAPQPIGPWAIQLDRIPFADEDVVNGFSPPIGFQAGFTSLVAPQIYRLVRQHLRERVNKILKSPKVGELVVGIMRAIAEYFRNEVSSYLNDMGVLVSFRGILNDQHSRPACLAIEISVETACGWIEEEQDIATTNNCPP